MAPDRPGDRPPSAEEINRFAASAEELRKVGADQGTTVVFHFHTAQLVHTEREIRQVLDAAPRSQAVHRRVARAAHRVGTLTTCLRELRDRLAYVHLQDYRGWRYVNIGAGDLFPSISRDLRHP